jgi:hypothetical protein
MPPKLVEDMTEEDRKEYFHWLNYCNKEGGCLICDRMLCDQKVKREHLRTFYNDVNRGTECLSGYLRKDDDYGKQSDNQKGETEVAG